MINVRAGKLPGSIQDYQVDEGATIADVLATASLATDGFEVRVGGNTIAPENYDSHQVQEGDTILLARKIKGN